MQIQKFVHKEYVLNYEITREITVAVYVLSGYDGHFIIQKISKFNLKVLAIYPKRQKRMLVYAIIL